MGLEISVGRGLAAHWRLLCLGALSFVALAMAPVSAQAAKAHPTLGVFGSAEQPSFTFSPVSKVRAMAVDEAGDVLVADTGANEVQTVLRGVPGNVATGGTYKLCFSWKGAKACTPELAFNLPATGTPSVQSELRALPTVGPPGNNNVGVSGTGEGVRTVTFQNDRGAVDVEALECIDENLTYPGPPPSPRCTVTTTVAGATANVSRWNPDGTPSPFSALGSNRIDARGGGAFPGQCATVPGDCDQTPQDGLTGFGSQSRDIQITVDESGSPTDGDIYVTQSTKRLVNIFASDGKFKGQLTKSGPTVPGPQVNLGEACGVAVDPAGAVYVGDFNNKQVHKYVPSKSAPADLANNEDYETSFVVDGGALAPCTLAAGAGPTNGFLFVNLRAGELFKLNSATGATLYQLGSTVQNATVTVDRTTGHVLVAKASDVFEFDAAGASEATPITTIEAGGTVVGAAVDPTTGDALQGNSGKVYVGREDKATLDHYGPLSEGVPPEAFTAPPATNVTQTSATLHGSVDPNGETTLDCHFEWGPAEGDYSSGQAPCTPNPGDSGDPVAVSGQATGLTPHATYHYRVVLETGGGEAQGQDEEFIASTPPKGVTEPAISVTPVTAVLKATVNPNGGTNTQCQFEYGLTASYGSSAPCNPDPGSASADTAVSADITGLAPRTTYHFRVAITTDGGTALGGDLTFFTQDKPTIETQFASQLGESAATLNARIAANESPTTYRLEWGPSASYGNVVPVPDAAIGAGQSAVLADEDITGLSPGTTYHFRFVAQNAHGVTTGSDQVFTTLSPIREACPNAERRIEQEKRVAGVQLLPDCMALEMVSPPKKFNQRAISPHVSANGERIRFSSTAALGDTPGRLQVGGDPYVATREGVGWTTSSTSPPSPYTGNAYLATSFIPDFSRWFHVNIASARQNQRSETQSFRGGLSGYFQPISPLFVPQDGTASEYIGESQGASADHSRLYLRFPGPVHILPGDPKPAGGVLVRGNTYVAKLDSSGGPAPLELLARDGDGKAWGGSCGASLGAESSLTATANNFLRNQGAVSRDGSHAYFSTRPTQPVASEQCNSVTHKLRIMEREDTSTGPQVTELLASECIEVPIACDGTNGGDDLFQGASVDQSKVYFTTPRALADTDLDAGGQCSDVLGSSSGCDLYLYDAELPAGERLIQVSAGDATNPTPGAGAKVLTAIPAISGDGSHVYFVAQSILTTSPNPEGATPQVGQPNLYLYQRDEQYPDGRTAFVGTLAGGDEGSLWGRIASFKRGAYPVPLTGKDAGGNEVGGDGHILMLQSLAPLTGDDEDGDSRDIFRYDAEADPPTLERLSKAQRGGTDNSSFSVAPASRGEIGTDFAEESRWASEDGETVVFETQEALLASDDNDEGDSYLLREGRLARLPGTAGEVNAQIPRLAHDGSTVAFQTYSQLLPQDGDGVQDIYAARVEGGYPHVIVDPCVPDGNELCQGPVGAPPPNQDPPTAGPPGVGNQPSRPCPKGKRKASRKGGQGKAKPRCVPKRKAKRSKRANRDRRPNQ